MRIYYSCLAAISLTFIYLIRKLARHRRRQRKSRQFGCKPIPRFPTADLFGRDFSSEVKRSFRDGNANETARKHYEKVSSLTFEVGTPFSRVVYTADPINHQTIVSNMADWSQVDQRNGIPLFGDRANILQQEHAAWRQTRDLVSPLFKRAEVMDIDHFRKFVDHLVARIPRDGSGFDMQPVLRKLFLDSCTEFIFGESINSLEDSTGASDEFTATFNRAVTIAASRTRPTLFNKAFFYPSANEQSWYKDCKAVHDFVDRCVTGFRHRPVAHDNDVGARQKRYVLLEGMSEAISDPTQLRFQLLGIFTIARDTIAMACSNMLFLLARNPEVWKELRVQALALGPDTNITFERLRHLPLFRYTVLETLRLHCPVTRMIRTAARDTILPHGGGHNGHSPTLVKQGTTVWCDRFPKFRDENLWGEDVESFRPSRFEGKRLGWEFLPFSGGPRKCPASQQVMTQCVYLLIRLTREFETIENHDPHLEYVESVMMCFESRNGCKIAFPA